LKCAPQPKIAKNRKKITKTVYFENLSSFKVIDFGTPGKLVNSAGYDSQQVSAYLQPFLR